MLRQPFEIEMLIFHFDAHARALARRAIAPGPRPLVSWRTIPRSPWLAKGRRRERPGASEVFLLGMVDKGPFRPG